MPDRVSWGRLRSLYITGIGLMAIGWLGCARSTSPELERLSSQLGPEDSDPAYRVPEGNDATILAFVKDLQGRQPDSPDPEHQRAEMARIQSAIARAGNKLLAQSNEEKVLTEATRLRLIGAMRLTMLQNNDESRFAKLAADALDAVKTLKQDKRPAVAQTANNYWLTARALSFKTMSSDEQQTLADEAIANIRKKYSNEGTTDIVLLSDQFVDLGDFERAADLLEQLAKAMNASNDANTKKMSANFWRRSNRLRLVGKPLELEGTILGGGQLDWPSYRGKVVLVDFWATWCGPCRAELPNVKTVFEKYHDRGFEVIAISLDADRKELQSFLKTEPLPWPQLFDDRVTEKKIPAHPMAIKYEVSSIPAAFLVNQAGNVVSVEARGEVLERELKKLLGSGN